MTLNEPNPVFKVTPLFDAKYLNYFKRSMALEQRVSWATLYDLQSCSVGLVKRDLGVRVRDRRTLRWLYTSLHRP